MPSVADASTSRGPDDEGGLAKFLTALEHAGDAIEITDERGQIEYVNVAFERQTGFSRQDAIGRTPASLFRAGQHPDEFYDAIEAELSAGNVWRGELTGRRRDGTFFPQYMTVAPVRDVAGRITHHVAIKRDLTGVKQAQAAMLLADRLSSLGTLAAGVGHEINNPLGAVLASLAFIRDALPHGTSSVGSTLRDELDAALADAIEGAERIRDIVADLRGLTRPDETGHGPIQVRSAVETAVRMVRNEIRHRATLTVDLGDAGAIWANEARLVQVFLNLLMNAAQALPAGEPASQRIDVRVRRGEHGGARVDVADTGVGIAPENLTRIFDPFFTTKPVGMGTGLGLSICHSIVTSLGGEIRVASEVSRGTTFTVSFPPAPESAAATVPERGSGPSPVRLRVLVIDDEPAVGRALRRMLSGHDVTLSGPGDDAIGLVLSGAYDAFLCDVMMPGLSGLEIYARVRERDPALVRRFVFVTGGAFTSEAEEFLASVPNEVIRKPFSAESVRAALARTHAGR